MRTKRIIAAAVAAGVVGAGAVVTPVVLAADDPEPTPSGPRWSDSEDWGGGPMAERRGERFQEGWMHGQGSPGAGHGMGRGAGHGMGPGAGHGMGPGAGQQPRGDGDCPLLDDAAKGTLASEQESTVAEQAELEKMSHDLYVVFAEQNGDYRFERIAAAETRHLDAVRTLMDRYGIDDPTVGLDEGEFTSEAVQTMYDDLLDEGSESLEAALKVSQEHERQDIAGLETFAEDVDAPDAAQVFEHLADGSEMHLQAFSR